MNCLPLLSHELGSNCFFFLLRERALVLLNVAQSSHHSEIVLALLSLILDAIICLGKGGGPMGVTTTALSASLFIGKPK